MSETCPGCPGRDDPGCEHPMCLAFIRHGERQRTKQAADVAAEEQMRSPVIRASEPSSSPDPVREEMEDRANLIPEAADDKANLIADSLIDYIRAPYSRSWLAERIRAALALHRGR